MPNSGKSKYQRDVERAQSLGFSSPYAMRKARAQQRGYTSPRAERTAREKARGVSRDYAAERERANIRAQARGFRSVRDQARFNREQKSNPAIKRSAWQKARVLEFFDITEYRLRKIRQENKKWASEYGQLQFSKINTYNDAVDADVHNWSEARIGYILAFHAAIVNPKSNYESLTRNGKREFVNGKPKSNSAQFYYLVKYTNLMQQDEFEARYGSNVVHKAEEGKVQP